MAILGCQQPVITELVNKNSHMTTSETSSYLLI